MSTRVRPEGIPDWKLERYLLDELSQAEARTVAALEQTDLEVRARLETLRASSAELLERYPTPWMSRRIQQRLEAPAQMAGQAGWRQWLAPRLAAPAAVIALTVALLVSLPVEEVIVAPASPPGIRIKGLRPHLILHRKTAQGSERLEEGAVVRRGDRILVQYQAAGAAYGAILSVDGRGAVTRHFPDRGEIAALLRQDGPVPLEFSYELDDAPQVERFFFVTAAEPFAVEVALEPARRAARGGETPEALRLPPPLSQAAFALSKSSLSPAASQ